MFTIQLEIDRIDYAKSVSGLLPAVINNRPAESSDERLSRIVKKLGTDAVPAVNKIISFLKPDQKDQLLVWAINQHSKSFVPIANQHLEETFSGPAIQIGSFSASDLSGTKLRLFATHVTIDYTALLNSPLLSTNPLGGPAKLAMQFMNQEMLEKQSISLLSSDLVKPKILASMENAMEKSGLFLTLGDYTISQKEPASLSEPQEDNTSILESLENALVAWMKEALHS